MRHIAETLGVQKIPHKLRKYFTIEREDLRAYKVSIKSGYIEDFTIYLFVFIFSSQNDDGFV